MNSIRIVAVVLALWLVLGGTLRATSGEVVKFNASCEADFQRAQEMFKKLEAGNEKRSIESILTPLNELWIILDRNSNLASLYQFVHPDPEMRETAAEWEQKYSKLETEIALSRPIYEAVSMIDLSGADEKISRFTEHTLRDFRRTGVDKDEETREKIKNLQEELVIIGQNFEKNIREDVRYIELESSDELAGLPEDYIKEHQPDEGGKIHISTDYPDYYPFMTYAHSDTRRLELYREYRRRGYPANEQVLQDLLYKRYQLAKMLGYENYAEYVTEDKMIKTPAAAKEFINKVTSVANERAARDYDELLRRLRKDFPEASGVGDWQKLYVSELVKNEIYDFDSKETRSYFAYERVREGLFDLTSALYGVSFEKVDTAVWHPSVEIYDLLDQDGVIGRFYLDMHPRKDKFKHAMMSQVVTGVSGLQKPEAALVCNFPGGDEGSGLMEHDQVLTFFHEFGHLLHHLFAGDQPWIKQSGISTEWDFVETPSILYEEWAWHREVLKKFARNDAGEAIPDELISKMNRTRKFGLGLNVKQQMFYAAISLNFYNRDSETFEPLEMVKELQQNYTPYAYVPDTYMHLAFGHLVDYSAIYYTYMWSEVIVKDLFHVFEKEGLLNQKIAMKYRHSILNPGGSRDASQLVEDFLGRPYSFEAFRNWLNSEDI
ncbi:MAG: tetraacyldisaccharide 4'-kinase [Calditrichaeota bacterium]|nr:Zn-dependent oligopeptidase [Calditrichota bacterium]RQW04746.1 MAG: tetraacyldisaccharide 4'-kinase [Calditrichota bacterium]